MQAQIDRGSHYTTALIAAQQPVATPSPWLYLAGLIVTLSGLFAVNYGLPDTDFAAMTYALAVSGYLLSYLLRWRGISLRALQTPLIVCLGLALFALYSSDRGLAVLLPDGVAEDRAKTMQMVFVWIGIIHSFVLTSDAAVLFACVPCMTMLALVSTLNGDPAIQHAFILFIGAATFLMVHENFLRTQAAAGAGRSEARDRKLFGGQVGLVAVCIVGALVLANLVAVPIRTVGQTLFDMGTLTPLTPATQNKQQKQNFAPISVSENNAVELATGAGRDSDTVLMRVKCDRGLMWRGMTFATYTGHSFSNPAEAEANLLPSDEANNKQGYQDLLTYRDTNSSDGQRDVIHFDLSPSPYELPPGEMKGSSQTKQTVSVVAGAFTQLYGAGNVIRVDTVPTIASLHTNAEGSLMTSDPLPINTSYNVVSQVANDDPRALRAASSDRAALPLPIASRFLQTAPPGQPENATLRALAQEITRGLNNNFDKAEAIEKYIGAHCRYNLKAAATPRSQDVVETFLTQTHEGYCDSFGAAMTMLCRYAGIPARLASGFLYGDLEPDNSYTVREKHKHIWSEVFFPRIGWITYDATELAQDVTPKPADTKKAAGLKNWLASQGALPKAILAIVGLLLLWVFKTEVLDRWRGSRRAPGAASNALAVTNQEILTLYQSATGLLGRRALRRAPYVTPDEFVRQVETQCADCSPQVSVLLQRLTDLATRSRYGGQVASSEEVEQARATLTELKREMSKVKRGDIKPMAAATTQAATAHGAGWR